MGGCFSLHGSGGGGDGDRLHGATHMLSEELKLGPSQRLQDDYKVTRHALGYGRYGAVRQGTRVKDGEQVAIKTCAKRVLNQRPDWISRTGEIEALIKLSEQPCDSIIRLVATYEDQQNLYIVTELARGGELFSNISERPDFGEYEASQVARQLLEAVAHCHRHGIMHRDIKPDNLLFADEAGTQLKLVDFGSATPFVEKCLYHDFMSTPYYAAPEVWARNYNASCDMWAVGATIYVMMRGGPPTVCSRACKNSPDWQAIQRGEPMDLPDSCSSALRDLLAQLLTPDTDKRLTATAALRHPWIHGDASLHAGALPGSSMRGLRLYARVVKFQDTAAVLLAVQSSRCQALVQKYLTEHAGGTSGAIRVTELEGLLMDNAFVEPARQLKGLRLRLLGSDDGADGFELDAEKFKQLLAARQLALSQDGHGLTAKSAKVQLVSIRPSKSSENLRSLLGSTKSSDATTSSAAQDTHIMHGSVHGVNLLSFQRTFTIQ